MLSLEYYPKNNNFNTKVLPGDIVSHGYADMEKELNVFIIYESNSYQFSIKPPINLTRITINGKFTNGKIILNAQGTLTENNRNVKVTVKDTTNYANIKNKISNKI